MRHRLGQRAIQGFSIRQRLVCVLPIGDVQDSANDASRATPFRQVAENDAAAPRQPSHASVGPDDANLGSERAITPGPGRRLESCEDALTIVRVQERQKTVQARFGLRLNACDRAELRRVPRPLGDDVDVERADPGGLVRHSKPLLALLERLGELVSRQSRAHEVADRLYQRDLVRLEGVPMRRGERGRCDDAPARDEWKPGVGSDAEAPQLPRGLEVARLKVLDDEP